MKPRATRLKQVSGGVRSIAAATALIFASAAAQGSQMFRYDVSNTAYLSSDQYGITPLTAIEQPVGLMLDGAIENRGQNIAPPLTAASWSLGSAMNVTFSDNVMQFPVAEVGSRSVPAGTVSGRLYWAEFEVSERVSGVVTLPHDNVASNARFVSTTGKFSHIFRSGSTFLSIYTNNFVGKIRNIKVQEITFTNLWSDAATTFVGGANKVSTGVYRVNTSDGSLAAVDSATLLTVGKWYEAIINIDSVTVAGGGIAFDQAGVAISTMSGTGFRRFVFNATSSVFRVRRVSGATDIQFSGVSVRELKGNHLHQPTSTARPVLSARLNLITYSEQFDNAAWTKNTATVTPNADVAPDGTTTADSVLFDATSSYIFQQLTSYPLSVGTVATISCYTKTADRLLRFGGASVVGTDQYSIETLADGWYRQKVTRTFTTTGTVAQALLNTTTPGAYVVWGMQVVFGTQEGRYQRIAAATDYDAVGFPMYLRFDGVDDCLFTPGTVDFSGTDKVTVVAGIQKNSDATTGIVLELSSTIGSNDGAFYVSAPNAAASPSVAFAAKGTTQIGLANTSVTAPRKLTISGIADIGAPYTGLRVDSFLSHFNSTTLGTGNFGNFAMYVGRRGNASLQWNGQLYTLMGIGRRESPDNLLKLEAYAKGAMA